MTTTNHSTGRFSGVRKDFRERLEANRWLRSQFKENVYRRVLHRLRRVFGMPARMAHEAAWGAAFEMEGLADDPWGRNKRYL